MIIPNFMARGFSEDVYHRVVCPDCGSGGASKSPCFCHKCPGRVLCLPACNDHIECNWAELARKYRSRNDAKQESES